MFIIYVVVFTLVASVVWLLVADFAVSMKKKKPKGKDFFNWDLDINNKAGRDGWDESLYDEIY